MTTKEKLLAEIREIIVQGEQHVLHSGRPMGLSRYTTGEVLLFADDRKHTDWICRCRNLVNVLGKAADPWRNAFKEKGDETQCDVVRARLGALEALERAVQNDLLVKIENLVHAEALGSLLEQAEHLNKNGYYVAACVLGRSVLEEHLRNLCLKHGCMPSQANPTVNSYNMALYPTVYDKIKMQHVTGLATIGNDAAHQQKATKDDCERLLRELPSFMATTA